MVFARRRYYFWLVQAYIKKWKRTIISSLVIGAIIFFASIFAVNFYLRPLLERTVTKIGFTGLYTPSTLPDSIWSDVSFGLTSIQEDGSIKPAAASKWEVRDDGKDYIFTLSKGQEFDGGEELTANNLPLEFKDVQKKILDPYTVEFKLKSPYAPFLITVTKPILLKNFNGLSGYKVGKIDLSAGFVKSITLQKKSDQRIKKIFYFYPTEQALKLAYMLGEVDKVDGVNTLTLNSKNLADWKNTAIKKRINYNILVTVFYNNNDSDLSNKKLREALNYAIPDTFRFGERAYSPIPPSSIYYRENSASFGDMEIAKTLFSSAGVPEGKVFELSTSPELKDTALILQKAWAQLGFKTKIKVVDEMPTNFQMLLYEFTVPKDPDQYTLWHSQGINNIANYRKNKRIDKLLEDGRLSIDIDSRKTIYNDFQKYLVDDVPASFLYFPYEYTLSRKSE